LGGARRLREAGLDPFALLTFPGHKMTMFYRRALLIATGALAASGVRAQEPAWQALLAGGCALLLRHAQTEPGVGDPPGFRPDQCNTQRNLSSAGREQALRIGEALRRRGVIFDEVLSSRWCRCIDTARLVAPAPRTRVFEPLNSTFNDRALEPSQSEALRRYLAGLRPPRRALLVTHQVNISALAQAFVAMGEGLVVSVDGANVNIAGRLNLGA
jgi:phosphohistidine phosphatase SixA